MSRNPGPSLARHDREAESAVRQAAQAGPEISVVVLAYNESASLQGVIEDLLNALSGHSFEIVVIDDGSTDGTGAIADELSVRDASVRVVHHPSNRGGGAAIRTGLGVSRGEFVAVTPGDGQFVAADLPRLLAAARLSDVVVTRRINRTGGLRRRVASRVYRMVIRAVLGLRVHDVNWVKIYRRTDVQGLTLTAESWLLDAEILYRLSRAGRSFTEVDVSEMPRTGGTPTGSRPLYMIAAARELWRFSRHLRATEARARDVAELHGQL